MNTFTISKRHFALLLLTVATVFTACKKEDTVIKDPDPTSDAHPHLTRLELNPHNYIVLGYTTDGYLNKFKLVNDYLVSEVHFGYNDAKRPIAGVIDGFDMAFVYNGAVLDKITYTAATPNPLMADSYLKFTYLNGRVSQTVQYYKTQGNNFVPSAKHVYDYYANGDVKTETYYYLVALPDQYEQIERNEYEYDDKVNAMQMPDEITYALYLNKAAHNIKKVTTYDASDGLDETKSYSLNYNKFGLPTTGVENTTYPNSPAINRNLTYSYQ
jgi:hypothetical protein